MDDERNTRNANRGDSVAGVGSLVQQVFDDVRNLLRDEVALAKAEFNQALKKIITGAILLATGGVLASTGLTALVAAAILGLSTVWAAWLAALVVGLLVIVAGALLAYAGIKSASAAELAPDRTIQTLKEDARVVKEEVP